MRKLITLVLFVYTISSYPSGEALFPKVDLTCHEAYTADGMSHLRSRTPARIPVVYQISWYDLPQIVEMFWIIEEGV